MRSFAVASLRILGAISSLVAAYLIPSQKSSPSSGDRRSCVFDLYGPGLSSHIVGLIRLSGVVRGLWDDSRQIVPLTDPIRLHSTFAVVAWRLANSLTLHVSPAAGCEAALPSGLHGLIAEAISSDAVLHLARALRPSIG